MRTGDDWDDGNPEGSRPGDAAAAEDPWMDDDETPLPEEWTDPAGEWWDDEEPEPDAADFCFDPADED